MPTYLSSLRVSDFTDRFRLAPCASAVDCSLGTNSGFATEVHLASVGELHSLELARPIEAPEEKSRRTRRDQRISEPPPFERSLRQVEGSRVPKRLALSGPFLEIQAPTTKLDYSAAWSCQETELLSAYANGLVQGRPDCFNTSGAWT